MVNHTPQDHEVETFSGRFVDVSNPSPESIDINDIAHALSQTCRYGGHCLRYFSVAEHAVFVSRRVERKGGSPKQQLAALHHDDSEAYLGDIPRPMKPLLGEAYRVMTDMMDEAIVLGLDLVGAGVLACDFHDPAVKAADTWALFVEARHLLPSEGRSWNAEEPNTLRVKGEELLALPSRIVIPDYWHGGLLPGKARNLYLARHKELMNAS